MTGYLLIEPKEQNINIAELPSGIYSMKIFSEKKMFVKKLIKQ